MGSTSDLPVMQDAVEVLKGFDIEVEVDIVSAHRTPDKLFDYGKNAHERGISVIIAGAGGAVGWGCRACCTKPGRIMPIPAPIPAPAIPPPDAARLRILLPA